MNAVFVLWRLIAIDPDGFILSELPWTSYAGAVEQYNAMCAAGFRRMLLEHTPIRQ
jgi:hypothetical protein